VVRGTVAGPPVGTGAAAGAPGARRAIVGAGVTAGVAAGAVLRGTVGAGAGAGGAAELVTGTVGGAGAVVEAGGAAEVVIGGGGAGERGVCGSAFRETRTVSFLIGTAEVRFIGAGGFGGCLSSLISRSVIRIVDCKRTSGVFPRPFGKLTKYQWALSNPRFEKSQFLKIFKVSKPISRHRLYPILSGDPQDSSSGGAVGNSATSSRRLTTSTPRAAELSTLNIKTGVFLSTTLLDTRV